jgi:hypothetical protein
MSFVTAVPEMVVSAAADIGAIGSVINTANATASASTTRLVAMAGDEVSTEIEALFRAHADIYRELSAEAAASFDRFVRALAASANSYAAAEAASASALQSMPRQLVNAVNASTTALLGRPLIGDGSTGGLRQGNATGEAGGGFRAVASMLAEPLTSGPTTALLMGPSGWPLLSPNLVAGINNGFIQTLFPGANPQALFMLNQAYPITGAMSLTFDASVAQGVTILHNAIQQAISNGNNVVVFGYSQSAVVATMEMRNLAALPPADRPDTSQLSFILTGNPNTPNGGLFSRFSGLSLSSIGMTLSGATPDNVYPTTIYIREYDGYADFPQYPINVISTLNAVAGMVYVHGGYPFLTPEEISSAIPLPTVGTTQTNYYLIPAEQLPLLQPLRLIPGVGNTLADLIEPSMRTIVNLGYGDPAYGYSTGPANVPTPFGLFPNVDPNIILADLMTGAQQGIGAVSDDFSAWGFPSGGFPSEFPSLSGLSLPHLQNAITPNPFTASGDWVTGVNDALHNFATGANLAIANPASLIDNFANGLQVFTQHLQTSITDAGNIVTNAVVTGVSTVLPTVSLGLFFGVTLPAYNLNLALEGLRMAMAGDPMGLVNAIGYPIAASPALSLLATLLYLNFLAGAVGVYPFMYQPLQPG